MRLMRGQPHERCPLVSALSGNLGPETRNIGVCAPDGYLTANRRTPGRFDAAQSTTPTEALQA
jgi:hypothetical protein